MSDTPKWEDTTEVASPVAPSADVPHWDDTVEHRSNPSMDLISRLSNKMKGIGTAVGEGLQTIGNDVNDTALGAINGAAMGLPDEFEGGLRAGVDAIQNGTSINPLNPEFIKKYRAYQEQANKKYEQAEERSPWLYGGGGIIGGVATSPFIGAAGLASTGGRAAIKAGFAASKMAGTKALAKEIGKDIMVGAPLGAVYGFGESDGKMETEEGRDQLTYDSLLGGATGSIVGGGVSLLSNGAPVAASYVAQGLKNKVDKMDGPLSRIIKKAYNKGEEGVNLSDHTTQTDVFQQSNKYSTELLGDLEKADDMFGKLVGKSVDEADAAGVKINVDESLNQAADKIDKFVNSSRNVELDTKTRDIIGRILTLNSKISPSEAQYLRKQFGVLSEKYAGRQDVHVPVLDAFQTIQSGLKTSMDNQVSGYKEAAKNFENYRRTILEQILAGKNDPQRKNLMYGALNNAEDKLQNRIEKMVQGSATDGGSYRDERVGFKVLQEKLRELQKTNPEAFTAMGKTAEDIISGFRDAADTEHMIQTIVKTNPHEGLETAARKGVTGLSGTGKATMVGVANKIGLHGDKVGPAIFKYSGLGLTKKALFDLPLESVGAMANHLAEHNSPAIKNLGAALQKAVQNKDAIGKNAVLFSIMQNPNTRKMFDIRDDDESAKKIP